jgi:competence protein ComEA
MKQALWKVYFSFSKKERRGIILLLMLTVICAGIPALWEYCMPPATALEQDSILLAEISAFRRELSVVASGPADSIGKSRPGRLFHFDPNTLEATGWTALGVSDKTIRTIQHYLAKGGKFRYGEDLLRIYGLPPALGRKLIPYVSIKVSAKVKDTGHLPTGPVSRLPLKWVRRVPDLDINTADSAQWESLPGIGPVLAARIVKFRDRLGGFYEIGQVRETFGLPDSTFNKIQPYLRLNKVSLKKLDINQTDEKSLAQHPYIRYKLARLIVLYRSNHGPFSHPKGLLGIPLVDDSIYRKIEHYIKIENSPL